MKSKFVVFVLLTMIATMLYSNPHNVFNKKPVKELKSKPKKHKEVNKNLLYTGIKGTVYHCVKAQCDDTPLNTATGYFIDTNLLKTKKLRIVALSRDLIRTYRLGGKIKYGQKIYIDGPKVIKGWWTVRDCMPSYRKKAIDFLQPRTVKFGVWKDIKLYKTDPTKKKSGKKVKSKKNKHKKVKTKKDKKERKSKRLSKK